MCASKASTLAIAAPTPFEPAVMRATFVGATTIVTVLGKLNVDPQGFRSLELKMYYFRKSTIRKDVDMPTLVSTLGTSACRPVGTAPR